MRHQCDLLAVVPTRGVSAVSLTCECDTVRPAHDDVTRRLPLALGAAWGLPALVNREGECLDRRHVLAHFPEHGVAFRSGGLRAERLRPVARDTRRQGDGKKEPQWMLKRKGHFNALASKPPTFEPPDFDTYDVRNGTALLTMSGESPSFENEDAAPANPPPAPANPPAPPARSDSPRDVPPSDGAALSSESIPGTAVAICENSSALRRDFATPNSVPAAPAACSGVAPISFDSAPTNSGFALTAAVASALEPVACARPADA